MGRAFSYQALDLSKSEIRLISIEPGSGLNPLKGHIFHVPLSDATPKYHALSYAWGEETEGSNASASEPSIGRRLHYYLTQWPLPPGPSGWMFIDDEQFKIRPNLEAALRHLRSETKQLVLWIDAICIDQQNTTERSEQVSQMRTIYRRAEDVHVWLGPATDDSGMAMRFLQDIARLSDDEIHGETLLQRKLTEKKWIPDIESLVPLFKRPYWTRAWVVQEIVNAKHAIVHCGLQTVTWTEIEKATRELRNRSIQLSYVFHASIGKVGTVVSQGPSSIKGAELVSKENEVPTFRLLDLLLTHERKKVSNLKDKVYAVVGISEAQDDPAFQVDYSRSIQAVYTDVVAYLISRGSLNVICASHKYAKLSDLPSWVPDWSVDIWPCRSHLIEPLEHDASAGTKAKAHISPNQRILHASGFIFDTIQHVGGTLTRAENSLLYSIKALENFHAWRKILLSVKVANEETDFGFMRSLFCNTYVKVSNKPTTQNWPHAQVLGAFGSLTQRLLPNQYIDPKLQEYIHTFQKTRSRNATTLDNSLVTSVSTMTRGRRFFITNKGEFGTAANDVEVGDLVVCFLGCAYFVVLRPVIGVEGEYTLMGDAYVDGKMNGEAMRDFDVGGYIEREFEIR
ncbi:heterokaryon incompatibility protein-domain-containing protein [Amylocarpus encephaloides]|uniref:Heterokaryon incompatibility protein-domain-containing protein n=1 Tax=Amylocarpus encephaloides TaxID=45428 RepID=A0A9P8C1K4_9HELO|nr:heterokaryon incompatibility protein-domain-containing protein [Amylocarpus encephaloides]